MAHARAGDVERRNAPQKGKEKDDTHSDKVSWETCSSFGCELSLCEHVSHYLSVKTDAEPLSGEQTSSWTPEKLQEQPPSATAATSASALRRGPSTVHAPTWAFNRHSGGPHMCAGGCCPPVASLSSASPDYAGPPSMYPGVDSLPYGLLGSCIRDAVRGGRGDGLRLGNRDHQDHLCKCLSNHCRG